MNSNRKADQSRSTLMNEFTSTASSHYMSDRHFRILTVLLIVFTVSVSIIVPKIEFVLSIIGSTTGTIICFVFPGLMYTQVTRKNTTERLLALFLTYFGLFVLFICTFSSLNSFSRTETFDPDVSVRSPVNEKVAAPVAPVIVVLPIIEKGKVNLVDTGSVIESGILKQKQEELLRKLEKNQEEQKQLIEEQKKVLREFNKHQEVQRQNDKPIVVEAPHSNYIPVIVSHSEKAEQVKTRNSSPDVPPHVPERRVKERKESANLSNQNAKNVSKELGEKSSAVAHIHDLHNESVKVTASQESRPKNEFAVKDF